YSFEVPEMELHVTVNKDASVTMQYAIQFHCNDGADPIDIVDIGLPHANYDISNMSAALDGVGQSDIRISEYVTPGVEIHLSPTIGPGETALFEFKCTMPDMVYQDTTNKANASLRITPTWFDGSLLTGTTQLSIVIYLPDDLKMEEILYQLNRPFSQKLQVQGHKAVAWFYESTRVDDAHMVGVSFPKRDLDRVVTITNWQLFMRWWTRAGGVRFWVGITLLVLFSILFFRATAGTGFCAYFLILIVLAIMWAGSPTLELLFIPVLILLWILSRYVRAAARRSYLPAIASVPGGEIKRGLAVPEAAVMMEEPLGRVLTFVIFGLLKKRLVVQTSDDPLTVELVEGYDTNRRERRRIARDRGTTIRGFEQDFLDVIAQNPGVPVRDIDFSTPMRRLIRSTAKRLAGFDLERTREYYKSIMDKAWAEAEQIGDLTRRTEYVDDNLGWLLLHDSAPTRFAVWDHSGYNYRPAWTRTSGGGAPLSMPSTSGGRTTAGDVAASFSGWLENVTGHMASRMDPISIGIKEAPSINLAGMDKVTGDILKAMAESSGGSSGGFGGGCACACAGCACACACAGGGR
ncbi:MAG: hypothetical protein J7M38_03075, partial [Armatimonadetes bacterium]|nr:hypothetical protein [Armatimonadota bacterium]